MKLYQLWLDGSILMKEILNYKKKCVNIFYVAPRILQLVMAYFKMPLEIG